jgi:hypothetical protein
MWSISKTFTFARVALKRHDVELRADEHRLLYESRTRRDGGDNDGIEDESTDHKSIRNPQSAIRNDTRGVRNT